MKNEKKYECSDCNSIAVSSGAIPDCCGKPMNPKTEVCRDAPHAEMARNENPDGPCDDGREG
jgi:hypothetical protein